MNEYLQELMKPLTFTQVRLIILECWSMGTPKQLSECWKYLDECGISLHIAHSILRHDNVNIYDYL